MQNNSKGFIQMPILIAIIVGIVIIGGGSYLGVKQYQNYQTKKISKEQELKKAQDLLAVQQKTAEEEKNNIEKQKQEEQDKQKSEMEKLKKEVEVLKNKKPEIIQQTIVKEAPAPKIESDLPSIINQWRPRIAYVVCEWRYSDTNEISARASGSGILTQLTDSKDGSVGMSILTNRHVILKDNKYQPYFCDIFLPGVAGGFRVFDEYYEKNGVEYSSVIRLADSGLDFGHIVLHYPNDYIKSLALRFSICKETASVGEKIVILGYPGIGSQTDITATEGIISGRDGNYYITSAKVERGNSGGVAISQKNNCYLGIPTFVEIGDIESLARILDAHAIFVNF